RRVLYEHVAARRRQRLHQRVGEELEKLSARNGCTPAELASHFLRSQDHERAVGYLEAAAEVAGRRAASRELVSYLELALAESETLPPGAQRDETELRIRVALQVARIQAGNANRGSLAATYERVQELCAQVDDRSTRVAALRAMWLHWIL